MTQANDQPLAKLPEAKKESRISARVSVQVKEAIDIAANLVGSTANQFMAQAAYQAARQLIEHERIVHLSARDTKRVLDLLENPPEPNEALSAAAKEYKDSGLHAKN